MAGLRPVLNERRLRVGLALFCLALALPACLLAYRAYQQVQWEVFHRYRAQAEESATRLDRLLAAYIANEDARSFADYGFLTLGTQQGIATLQRSPLAQFPPPAGIPGLLGYFQVDSAGHYSSPLLPDENGPTRVRLDAEELHARRALSARIQAIVVGPLAAPAAGRDAMVNDDADKTRGDEVAVAAPDERADASEPVRNVFDRLAAASERQRAPVSGEYGNVADLKLEQRLQQKSLAQLRPTERRIDSSQPGPPERVPRKEQLAVLEPLARNAGASAGAGMAASSMHAERADAGAAAARTTPLHGSYRLDDGPDAMITRPAAAAPPPASADRRVRLFESELGPMTFELLDERYFLLFRNVWREGERYIQGMLIERGAFLDAAADNAWGTTPLAPMSNLLLAWQGEVLALHGAGNTAPPPGAAGLRGELLYRTRLSAPLAGVELIFGVTHLPLGPSTRYLGWLSLGMALVLAGGSFTIYRFGMGQIRLYRQQQDFVSAVSHELKTPLTSIRMYSEMLKAGWADDARKATYYNYIHDESERLSRLIANVLQLARMTHGQTALELKPAVVGAMIAQIAAKLAGQAAAAGFTVHQQIAADAAALTVAVDEDALTQVLINLVDNAIKFTPQTARKHIELMVERHGDKELRIGVRDHGRGVAREQMRRIFELFYRAENELTRETVGTGIGLALVQQLATAMHGRVDVGNREPGAEFSLYLPLLDPV